MRRPVSVAAGLLIWLIAGTSAAAQRPDPDCRDDRGVDRCAEAEQQRMRALYGVRSIEEHRDAGDQVRRVFYVDDYGRDVILIAFVRAPGRDPTVWVHYPQREGEPRTEPLSVPVPPAAWDGVLFRSALFDRELVRPREDPNILSMCIHAWVYTIEAVEPARHESGQAIVRRATEDACADGLVEAYAREVQDSALPLFPHCSRLDPKHHRNPASQLAACRILRGDRFAAADVYNRLERFRQVRDADDADEIAAAFTQRATIDWNGEIHDGANAEGFWAGRVGAGVTNLYYASIEGIHSRRVRFVGFLERDRRDAGDGEAERTRAPVEMIWVFTPAHQFEVESATVGAWEPVWDQ